MISRRINPDRTERVRSTPGILPLRTMVKLTKSVQVRLSIVGLFVCVSCLCSSNAYTFNGSYKISPKPCTVDTRTGTCMFVWECLKTEGKHLGMCVDGFMFGSCCGHNTSSNFVLDNNSITTSPATTTTHVPQETAMFTKFPSFITSSSTYRPWKTTTTTTEEPTTTSRTTTTTMRTTTTTEWTTTATTSRPTETTKRPQSHPVLVASSSTEYTLPFVTGNGSSIPDHHFFPSSTLSSTHNAPSTAALIGNKPPKTTTTTTEKPTTTATMRTTTSTQSPPLFPSSSHNNRVTPRPTTIFIDPRSTTTPQPNITLDKDYGCGVAPIYPQMRIVGGKAASFGAFPWQVSVRRTSFFGFSSTHRCGGALLNENWIATAGHCVDDLMTSQIRIRLGEWDFSGASEKYPHVERGVAKKVVHPSYNFFTYEHDLALIKLETPVILTPHINPICLPGNDDLLINENATVSGWGRLSEGGQLPSILQHVTVPILSNAKCREMFLKSGRVEHIPEIFLCAGFENGGRDSCQGDSGGPLQVRGSDNRWFLAGIISWGIGCAEPNMPGVCTRISKFTSWILKHVTA